MSLKEYNSCLDFIKAIACICVVFMHVEFPGVFGIVVQAMSRFCVPFFFMVSGYFCFYPGESDYNGVRMTKKINHIGIITLWASLFYLVLALAKIVFLNGTLSFSIKGVIQWLVFNSPIVVVGQLWFLYALLYDYLLFALLWKSDRISQACLFIIPILCVYVFMAQGLHLCGVNVPNMLYRNWLIEGFPFFMAGFWIHKNQKRIIISNNTLLLIVFLSTLLCVLERFVLGRDFGVNVFTFPQVFALFIYAINNSQRGRGWIAEMGKKYSMWVYILHPFAWNAFDLAAEKLSIDSYILIGYLRPVIVVLLSLFCSTICYRMEIRHKTLLLSKVSQNS